MSMTRAMPLLLAACVGTSGTAEQTVAPVAAECAEPFVRVGAVQGSGAESPVTGRTVTVQGVVVADFEGPAPALRGFYIQDSGDGDDATSDGIFVFNRDADDVDAGDLVRVTGPVSEWRQQTQLTAETIIACGTGTVPPAEVTLPLRHRSHLERFEGMLIRLAQPLYVTEHYQLGRYGEVVLSSGGRLPQPTAVAAPGAPAAAVQAANDLNRIILDDASFEQNPAAVIHAHGGAPLSATRTLRGGDRITGLTGVLTQTSAGGTDSGVEYRIRPAQHDDAAVFVAANPRPSAPPAVGGTLRVASFNVLNYFNTFEGCTAGVSGTGLDCRGAESAREFERQQRKIVAALEGLDADVVGILEIENDGYGESSAIADLVDRLNGVTATGRYAFIDADARTGTVDALGSDAIKVALIYRTDRVSPVGRTAVLASSAFVNSADFTPRNRPSLAQAFAQPDGAAVVISINHFKSKGGPCDEPDAQDGQGNCNAVRTVAARELAAWLATDPTGTADPDVLILGDLNAYNREDPIALLRRNGFTDLLDGGSDGTAYSYVFGGQWGYLDYALASASLLPQVTGAAAWHINADEPSVLDYNTNFKSDAQQLSLYRADPFRSSDHDPVLVGLNLRTRQED